MKSIRGFGFSSVVDEDPDFEQLRRNLDQAAALGADFVELPLFMMDVIAGGRVLPSQLARVKQLIAGSGLGFTVHGAIAVNLMQPRDIVERHMAVAKATVEVAAELGAVHAVFHTGKLPVATDAEIEAAYARQRDALASLGEFAAQHGVTVVIENIFVTDPQVHTALPSRLAAEIDAVAHPNIRACLDFSHAWITCTARGADFLSEAKALARVARHLHIHDSFGDPTQLHTISRSERVAYGLGDLHLPLGWGAIPWDDIMAHFVFEPDAIFNLELPPPYWFALEESVTRMRELGALYAHSRKVA
jgi:sugar phosphate isomerase/epimerase